MIRKFSGYVPPDPQTPTDPMEVLKETLRAMEADALLDYAAAKEIDVGKATSKNGLLEKIFAHLDAEQSG